MSNKITVPCSVYIEVDIEEMAYNMSQEDAESAMVEIDRVICDLDFTQKMAKRFIDLVKAEGVESYIDELKEYLK